MLLLLIVLLAQDAGWAAEGTDGAVAGGGAPAVATSLEMLRAGGNAAAPASSRPE